MTGFHGKAFDDATQLKLEIFRGYIREWLPVFLVQYGSGRGQYQHVNMFDFFAGPGLDAAGHPGSPLIIVDELRKFCAEAQRASGLDIRMLFNDLKADHIARLKEEVAKVACGNGCCRVDYSTMPFQQAFQANLASMQDGNSANLVIMDQFGVKEVTPELVRQFAECGATDILFFISSSYIRRFIDTPELGSKFDMKAEEVKTLDYNGTHRFVCDYFREKLGAKHFYLAPFSIKKGGNIHGVIFGSGSLLGLEKFLKVCWKTDAITGEANYNIDGDFSWGGQKSLFDSENSITKVDMFEQELKQFIRTCSPSNHDLYCFCLTKGFLPKKAREILASLRQAEALTITDLDVTRPSNGRDFYMTWDEYSKHPPRVRLLSGSAT